MPKSSTPKPKKPASWHRTHHLISPMNVGKQQQVRAFLKAWQEGVQLETQSQWIHWWKTGSLKGTTVYKGDAKPVSASILGTTFGQMCQAQVSAALKGFLFGLSDRIRELISGSRLSADIRHQLHSLNRQHAWCRPLSESMFYGSAGQQKPISPEARRLVNRLFKQVFRHTRKPNLHQLWPKIDQRKATLFSVKQASGAPKRQKSRFTGWLTLSTFTAGERLHLPLEGHPGWQKRLNEIGGWNHVASTIQLLPQPDGSVTVAVFADVREAWEQDRKVYQPESDILSLDIGMNTLFATDCGDLMGRMWLKRLELLDKTISSIAKHRSRSGLKVRSTRYDHHVQRLRGWVTTEVNRILNHLVATRKPARIILENLDFRAPNMSRRMNRLLGFLGKRVIETKLADLEKRYGITIEKVNPAYTSQECSNCGCVDPRNRKKDKFECKFCHTKLHADVNAARTVKGRRSLLQSCPLSASPKQVLRERLLVFMARHTRPVGRPFNWRGNPYATVLLETESTVPQGGSATRSTGSGHRKTVTRQLTAESG